jgi:hypothetical protein
MLALAPPATTRASRSLAPLPVALLLLFAIILPNPTGYVGGGGDDWFYVEAARCVARQGWCVPETHWAARWPLVAPMGASFALFGDSLLTSMIVPFVYAVVAVAAFVQLLELTSGRTAALVGGLVFVATATFAKGLLHPNIEIVELAWVLVAALAAYRAVAGGNAALALAAGCAFGLAIAARMTSLAWLPILAAALWLVPRGRRWIAIPFLAGLPMVAAGDMLINWTISGDALLGPHLSAAHASIPSSELPWIRGVLNLFANPQVAPTLLAALALLLLQRRTLGWRCADVVLAVAASLYAGALIYGLAIDPKPRMFLPVAAIAAALVGRLAVRAWESGERPIVGVLIGTTIAVGIVASGARYNFSRPGPLAAIWAAEYPGEVMIEDATRRFLTFTPEVRLLPVAPNERNFVIVLQAGPCREARGSIGSGWSYVRSRDFGRPNDPLNLCLFRRPRAV